MTTVSDIAAFLETIAPQSRKMSWDNVGLLCGNQNKEVHKILIALDPFEAVAQEAAQIGADLLLTHHPIIFQPIHSVSDTTGVGRALRILIQHDISAFNAHTNLDIAPNGVNDVLAKTLGLRNIQVISPIETDRNGTTWGLMRSGEVDTQPLEAFLSGVKEKLHSPVLRYVSGSNIVHRIAVGGGSCADELSDVIKAGCDTFVTSDAKYNDFWDAYDSGINLIDAGHFYTENPVCEYLRNTLIQAFPELEISVSKVHKDCMQFY